MARAAHVALAEGHGVDEVVPEVHSHLTLGEVARKGEEWRQRMAVARNDLEQRLGRRLTEDEWAAQEREYHSPINRQGLRQDRLAGRRMRTLFRYARGKVGAMGVLEDVTEDNFVRYKATMGVDNAWFAEQLRELGRLRGKEYEFVRELKDGEEYTDMDIVEGVGKLVRGKVLADTARKDNGLPAWLNRFLDILRAWVSEARALMEVGRGVNRYLFADEEARGKFDERFRRMMEDLTAQDVEYLRGLQREESEDAQGRILRAARSGRAEARDERPVMDAAEAAQGAQARADAEAEEAYKAEIDAEVSAALGGGASMNVTVAEDRVCRTRQEAMEKIGRKGKPLVLRNNFLGVEAVFNAVSMGKVASADSLRKTFAELRRLGYADDEVLTLHYTAVGNIEELFKRAGRMEFERAYKKKETRKGFLHLYSDFDMPQDARGYTADIEVLIHQEPGLPATAYVLSVGVQTKEPVVLGRAAETNISIRPATTGSVAQAGEDVKGENEGGMSFSVEGEELYREAEGVAEKLRAAARENGGKVYVRWTDDPERDSEPGFTSRNWATGQVEPGISVLEIDEGMDTAMVVNRLLAYSSLNWMWKKKGTMPFIFAGEDTGAEGSDGEPLIENVRSLGYVDLGKINRLMNGEAAIKAYEKREKARGMQGKVTDVFARKIWAENLAEAEAEFAKGYEKYKELEGKKVEIFSRGQRGAAKRKWGGASFNVEGARERGMFDRGGVMEAGNGVVVEPGVGFSAAIRGLVHASSEKFEKFDAAYVGKGVGAELYGWGIYFSRSWKENRAYWEGARRRGGRAVNYLVDVAAEEGDMLDIDRKVKKLIEGKPELAAGLEELYREQLERGGERDSAAVERGVRERMKEVKGYAGFKFYRELSKEMGSRRASEWLDAHGVRGVRYESITSRAKNYVIFNAENIRITHVNEAGRWSRYKEGSPDWKEVGGGEGASMNVEDARERGMMKEGVVVGGNGFVARPGVDFSMAVRGAQHASPHLFREFDTAHIGSGEGNQAYGWGLYFSTNWRVNKNYWWNFSGEKMRVRLDGKAMRVDQDVNFWYAPLREQFEWEYEMSYYGAIAAMRIVKEAWDKGKGVGEYINFYRERAREDIERYEREAGEETDKGAMEDIEEMIARRRGYLEACDFFEKHKVEVELKEENAVNYVVDLEVEEEELLPWDRELREVLGRNEGFAEGLREYYRGFDGGGDVEELLESNRRSTGSAFYGWLTGVMGGQKAASEWLLAHGVKGVKYEDAPSRRREEKTYNYVIFDGKDVKLRRVNNRGEWTSDEGAGQWQLPGEVAWEQDGGSMNVVNGAEGKLVGQLEGAVTAGSFKANEALVEQMLGEIKKGVGKVRRLAGRAKGGREEALAVMGGLAQMVRAVRLYLPTGFGFAVEPYIRQLEVLSELATMGRVEFNVPMSKALAREVKGLGEEAVKELGEAKLEEVLERVMGRVAEQLRRYAKREVVARMEKVLAGLELKKKNGKLKGGKMGAEGYRAMDKVRAAMASDGEAVARRLEAIQAELGRGDEASEMKRDELEGDMAIWSTFGNVEGMSFESAAAAYETLRFWVAAERFAWEDKKADMDVARADVVRGVMKELGRAGVNAYHNAKVAVAPSGELKSLGDLFMSAVQTMRSMRKVPGVGRLLEGIALRVNRAGELMKTWERERWVRLEALSRHTLGGSWRRRMDEMLFRFNRIAEKKGDRVVDFYEFGVTDVEDKETGDTVASAISTDEGSSLGSAGTIGEFLSRIKNKNVVDVKKVDACASIQKRTPVIFGRAAETDISIPPACVGNVARGGEDVNKKCGWGVCERKRC